MADEIPKGTIVAWSGPLNSIPPGWALCNGENNTPDLRGRFIIGASDDDGGIAKTNITGSLTQVGGAPNHNHSFTGEITAGYNFSSATGVGDLGGIYAEIGNENNLPPYYALVFIIKQ